MNDVNHYDGYRPDQNRPVQTQPLDMSLTAVLGRNPRHTAYVVAVSVALNVLLVVDWIWNYAVYS